MQLQRSKNRSFFFISVLFLLISTLFVKTYFDIVKKSNKKIIKIPDIKPKTTLASIQITLKEKHYKKIKKKRNKSLADGIMETDNDDYVPAVITFNDINYKATIRLKGDWTDHLNGIKWSYRIKLKGNKTILGMRKFSIHHPKTRGYVNEWLYHKANKDEKLMGLRYHFAEGFLHIKLKNSSEFINQNLGIYAIEENFDKRTIESNQRKEGVIIRISEQYFWKEAKASIKISKKTGHKRFSDNREPKFITNNNGAIETFSYSKIAKNKELNKQFIQAKNLLQSLRDGNLITSKVFDVDKLAMHTVLNNLFGAKHGLETINIRMYYNPIISKLEPISYDGNSGGKLSKFKYYPFTDSNKDTLYYKAIIKAIEKISKKEYVNTLLKKYNEELSNIEKELKIEFKSNTIINKEALYHNQTIMLQELDRLKPIE